MCVVRHMPYESFVTQNLMVAFMFRFGLRKSQWHAKLGQIRSSPHIKKILQKHTYLVQFCPGYRKCHLFSHTININVKKYI